MDHDHPIGTANSTAISTPARSTSPEPSPFGDPTSPAPPSHGQAQVRERYNPFQTPNGSRPQTSSGFSNVDSTIAGRGGKYFHSRRIQKGQVEHPWLEKKDPKERWVTIIPLIGIALGLCVSGFLIYDGLKSVTHHTYCPVLMDDFTAGELNTNVWVKEAEVGGYGYQSCHSSSLLLLICP
jgi:hypothetical protein